MNNIDTIIIHCSATEEGLDFKAKDIDKWHKKIGYKKIGYHYVIDIDGTIEAGRPLTMNGAHCNSKDPSGESYNTHSIGICYIGGYDKNHEPADTRTNAQKQSMLRLLRYLCKHFEIKSILGHRDTSPDKNNNQIIEPSEWLKDCPCFNVTEEYPVSMFSS